MNIGVRLRHFRDVHRLTQQEVAERIGMTREAYVRCESGKDSMGANSVAKVCELYRITPMRLLTCERLPEVACLTCKAKKRYECAQHEEDVERVTLWSKAFRFLRTASGVTLADDMAKLNILRKAINPHRDSPEDAACKLRRHLLERGGFTVESLPALLDEHGILFGLRSFYFSGTKGLTFENPNVGACIVVNDDALLPLEAKAFATAHELGHIILGTAHACHGSIGDHAPEEEAANAFARELLAPKIAVHNYWKRLSYLPFYEAVNRTKQAFKVRAELVIHQLEEPLSERFGKIDNAYKYYNASVKQHGLSTAREACPTEFHFASDGFQTYAFDAYRRGNISLSRLAELVGCPLSSVKRALRDVKPYV